MMLFENHQQLSERINRKIKTVPILLKQIQIKTEKNYSARIAMGETHQRRLFQAQEERAIG